MRSRRTAWVVLGLAAACYLAGFLLYPPRILINSDEEKYVAQAVAFAGGRTTLPIGDPFSAGRVEVIPSPYPPGTSLSQTPFVWLGGWQRAPWTSLVCLLATLALLAGWLQEAGFSPLFALLFLGYVPTLVLGRVAISDVPSALIVTAGLWLFWRGQDRGWPFWFGSGLVAGLSLLFRDANPLFFAPFFIGAVVRRERKAVALVVGGLLGVAARLLSARALFGSAFYVKSLGILQWNVASIGTNAPLYAFALLVMIPGGLVAAALYRGRRRPELIATAFLVTAFYVSFKFSGVESGAFKRLILGPRFFIPLAPILVFALAEVVTRYRSRLLLAAGGQGNRWVDRGVGAYCLLVAVAAFAVHPAMAYLSRGQAEMERAIYATTDDGAALITNTAASGKFISPIYGYRAPAGLYDVPPSSLPDLLRAHPSAYLVLVDRSDSEFFRDDMRTSAGYLAALQGRCRLNPLYDAQADPVDRLRIWKIASCGTPDSSR